VKPNNKNNQPGGNPRKTHGGVIARYRWWLPILLTGFFLLNTLQAVDVVASVDVNTITTGEVFTFKIEAIDADESPRVDISPLLDDFTIVSGPSQQTNIQWVNGKMKASRSLTWTLAPNHAGMIAIPSLPVKVGKRTLRTNSLQIKVTKTKQITKKNDLFLVTEIDKDEAYVGEQITITYKLYSRVNMSITDIQFPEFVGFWTEELFVPKQIDFRDTRIQGVRYKTATLYKIALFPTKTGDLDLSPMTVKCQVVVRKSRRSRSIWDDPFFNSVDPFFNPFGRETTTKILRSADKKITVKPYPPGQPADFTGAVGDFNITTTLDTTAVKINEAITLKVVLKGTGNLSLFSLPELTFPPSLEVFPPTSTIKKEPFRDNITGTITWEYILIPRQTGRFSIPRIELPYFNPDDRQWHRTVSKPIQLKVSPGKGSVIATSGYSKEEVTLLGKDIRYIRSQVPDWIQKGTPKFSTGTLIFYSLAVLFYFIPGITRNVQTNRLATAKTRRSKKALRIALKKLNRPADDIFTRTAHVIYQYLQDKFLLTSDKLDPHTVSLLLEGRLSPVDLEDLIRLLKTCDAGRFAPGAEVARETLVTDAKTLLRRIDKNA